METTTRKRWDCLFDASFAGMCRQATLLAMIHTSLHGAPVSAVPSNVIQFRRAA